MTDRFSHPLSIQQTTTPSQRSRQSPSRASVSSRASASQPAGRVDRTRTDRSRQSETAFLNPQAEQDARPYKAQTRSRASTTSRSRIPQALQGIGREELDIYLVRWDLLGDDELARACGTSSTSSSSTAVSNSTPGQATSSSRSSNPSQTQAQALSPTSSNAPGLTRSSSSLSSLQTPKPRPRPLKRLSTQILALTLPPSEDDTISREDAASSSTSTSYQDRRAEGLFPPSPPGNVPDFDFRSLQYEDRDQDQDQGRNLRASSSDTRPVRPPNEVVLNPALHPLRVLSRLTRELGEACLQLEEENRELRALSLSQSLSIKQEEEEIQNQGSRDVAGGLITPRKRSTGAGVGFGVRKAEGEGQMDEVDYEDQRDMDIGVVGGRRLSSVFREEDQVSLSAISSEAAY